MIENQPIDLAGLEGRVAAHLREQILQGELADGTRLTEVQLAESMSVSRGPVREALRTLAQEGLVELQPRRGAYVRWVPEEDLIEIVLIRGSVESTALYLAMRRNQDGLTATLQRSIDQMSLAVQQDSWQGLLNAEVDFHEGIYDAAQSRRLAQIWSGLRPTIVNSFRNDRAYYESQRAIVASHESLLHTIGTGDHRLAMTELRRHIQPSTRLDVIADEMT